MKTQQKDILQNKERKDSKICKIQEREYKIIRGR